VFLEREKPHQTVKKREKNIYSLFKIRRRKGERKKKKKRGIGYTLSTRLSASDRRREKRRAEGEKKKGKASVHALHFFRVWIPGRRKRKKRVVLVYGIRRCTERGNARTGGGKEKKGDTLNLSLFSGTVEEREEKGIAA